MNRDSVAGWSMVFLATLIGVWYGLVVVIEAAMARNHRRRMDGWQAGQARLRAQRDAVWARRDATRMCGSCFVEIFPSQRAELDGCDAAGNPADVWFCPHCTYLNADTKPQPTTPRRGK